MLRAVSLSGICLGKSLVEEVVNFAFVATPVFSCIIKSL